MSAEFIPRPYQQQIIDYIQANERCAIWAGMGLGKTVSTLTAIKQILDADPNAGPVLVLAPRRVAVSTWPDEVTKWSHLKGLRVSVVVGTATECQKALGTPADIYCTNYERIPLLVEKYGRQWPFKIIVADESTRLKSFRARQGGSRARELGRVAHLYCKRFIELTGTPVPNGYEDLWGQMWFIDHGKRLGDSMTAYRMRFFMPRQVGADPHAVKWELLPLSEMFIQDLLQDVTLKLNTEDWFDIDKPIVADIPVTLPAKVMKLYKDMQQKLYIELESGAEVESPNAAAMVARCLQIASGAIYTEDGFEELHKEKIEALQSIIEEASGAPVLVAYHFKHEAERILKAIKSARMLDKDPQTIRDWNAGKIRVLLAHPASCGHGLNLQDGGNILVFFSRSWNLEAHQQIIERIGPTRQAQAGHPRPVYIYNIVASDTLDEAVAKRLETKRRVQDILLERLHEANI